MHPPLLREDFLRAAEALRPYIRRTPLLAVVERVRREAAARGLVAGDSELVGLVPRAALAGASPGELGLPRLLPGQVIETTED